MTLKSKLVKTLTHILCGIFLLVFSLAGRAQPAYEFASGSGSVANGSVLTNQVITFQNNALNPVTGTYTPLTPTVTATFAISNQQYALPTTQNPNGGDLTFGANVNGAGKTPTPARLFPSMNSLSAPTAADFSATQDNIGTGMSTSTNYSVELFTSAMGPYNANDPTNGRYYIADLTVTFNLPLTDPVIHIVGLGGTYSSLGMTTELQLETPGVTLSELSGSTELTVNDTSILNSAAQPSSVTGSGAASGSILVSGNNVTTLLFHIYLRGDGKTPTWSNATSHTGDAWMFGVSGLNTFVALPLALTNFTARPRDHSVNLQWSSATHTNYFVVERSSDATDWTSIGITSAAATGSQDAQYGFVDKDPAAGANYYRLQQVDDNGNALYSDIREVNFTGAPMMSWYPNPVRDRLTISSQTPIQSVTLTTLDGRILKTFTGFPSGQAVDFSRYPFGIYILVIRTSDGGTQVAKIERS